MVCGQDVHLIPFLGLLPVKWMEEEGLNRQSLNVDHCAPSYHPIPVSSRETSEQIWSRTECAPVFTQTALFWEHTHTNTHTRPRNVLRTSLSQQLPGSATAIADEGVGLSGWWGLSAVSEWGQKSNNWLIWNNRIKSWFWFHLSLARLLLIPQMVLFSSGE